MSKFITGKKVREKLRPFEFFNEYIKRGLQPYSHLGEPIPLPDISLEIFYIRRNLRDAERDLEEKILSIGPARIRVIKAVQDQPPIDLLEAEKKVEILKKQLSSIDYSWKNFSLPESIKKAEKILNDLDEYLYIEEEVSKIRQLIEGPPPWKEGSDKKSIFPCEPGTKWEDITIILIANDAVKVKTPHGEGRFSYHELGMSDKRKGDSPSMLWELLKLFATSEGFISSKNPRYDPKLPDTKKRLDNLLQEVFQIKESIIVNTYRKEKGYRTKIHFSDARHSETISKSSDEDIPPQDIIDTFEEADNFNIKQIGGSQKKIPPQD